MTTPVAGRTMICRVDRRILQCPVVRRMLMCRVVGGMLMCRVVTVSRSLRGLPLFIFILT
jgi:hypothetical protein